MKNHKRTLSGLELLGMQKAKRAIAARLAEAMAFALGAVGVTIHLTWQDGEANERTGQVTFSTQTYVAWTQILQALPLENQEQVVTAHMEAALEADKSQADKYAEQFAENAKRRRLDTDAAAALALSMAVARPCKDCPPLDPAEASPATRPDEAPPLAPELES